MALVLCLTLLPTAALADELGPVDGTSTVETAGADAEAAAKAEAEAKAKAEAEAEEKAEAEAKAKAGAEAVAAVQAMIGELPDELTEENAEDVSAKLGEIDAAMAALGDEERAALDLTQYQAAIAALAALAAAQGEIALYADDTNKPHNGKGTTEDPYQITSTDELEWFRDTVNAGETGICAELMNNLDFVNKQNDSYWTWTPIGNSKDNAYVGTFDGNGYEIKKIRLVDVQAQSQTNRGLFGWIGAGGKVQDLAVSVQDVGNSSLSVSNSGLLSVNNAGTIERCSATISNLLHTDNFGMIAYENRGNITDCWSYVNATGNKLSISGKAAGIARTNTATISNCFFRGSFRTGKTDYAIAENKNGSITNCYYRDANGGSNGEVYIDGNKDTGDTVVWKSTSACASGEVAWLLNNSGSRDTWRMGSNKYPSLKKTDGRVNKNQDGSYNIGDKPHMHGDVEFTKVAALSDIKANGNYYIDAAVNVDRTWEVSGDVVLCLDGQTVTAKDAIAPAIKVSGSNSLTLLACKEGKITGSGGTSILVDSGKLTLGGKAQITGNDKNILLAQGSKISFDSLDPSAKFGISVENQKDLSDPVAVTDATGGQYFGQLVADGFKDNGVGFELYLSDDGKTVMLGKQSVHRHCICGDNSKEVNGHDAHSDITFQPWTRTDKLPDSGNYYLTRNVTLTGNAGPNGANVCLNGYTATLSDVGRINLSGTTQLTDCSVDGKGKLESYPGKANGGVAISGGNKFSLYGGTLNGVKVEIGQTGGGTFNMYGGKITGNTQGTVVGQSKTSNKSTITINMYGGEISGNNISENQGGGVFVGSGNQFNMYGGTIQNNSAVDGGGVYIAPAGNAYSAGEMTICGDAVIQGNKAGSVLNNVSLPSGKQITISGKLVENAKIGVTTRANLSQGNVNIATATDAGWVVAKNFTSDNSAYDVGLVNDGKTVQLQVHSHQWKYTANGATITATCEADGCPLTDKIGGTLTLVPPTDLIYDGYPKQPTPQTDTAWVANIGELQGSITYYRDNEPAANHADAGDYRVEYRVNGDNNAVAEVTYTIKKATPTATDFTFKAPAPDSLTYNGTPKTATVTPSEDKNGMGEVKVKYYQDDELVEKPTNAGKYIVKISVEEGTNYNAADDLTVGTLVINKINYPGANTAADTVRSGQATTDKTLTLPELPDGASYAASGTVGGATGLISSHSVSGTTLTYSTTKQANNASATITIPVVGATNYNDYSIVVTVTAKDKEDAGVSITGAPSSKTYGDANFTVTADKTASDGGTWTWTSSDDTILKIVDGANSATATVQVLKASATGATLTVTYESATHMGSDSAAITVAPKEVIVSGITASSKPYDGTPNATVNASGAIITGKETGDNLTVSVSAGSTFDSADVGSRTVTLGALTLGGASAGNYKLAASGNQTTATANITVRDLTVKPDSGQSKSYGTTPDPVLAYTSTGTVTGETAAFDGALSRKAGEDVGQYDITKGSLELKDSGTFKAANYNLVLDTAVVTFEIAKGTYGGSTPTTTVNILKNYAGVQTGTLTAADFFTTAPAEAKITVLPSPGTVTIMSSVDVDASGNLTYHSKPNIAATADENCAVTISSKNYTDINATLTFKLVDKTDVSAQITFPNGTLTYNGAGQKYEKATISGVSGGTWNYTYVANSGTGASLDSAGLPKTAGTYTVTAKYEDSANLGTKNAKLTISKATPTGAPTCTKITTSGKTLADAPLAIGTIAPAGGTLAWDMPASTVVAANTAYGWTYTPADTANYKALTGSLTPYAVSSGGGGGGGSSAATPSVSDKVAKELKNAKEGSTVAIDMKGETKLPASVTKEIAGKDVTVELDMGGGTVWSFNGLDVPKGGVRLDLGVKTGTKTIPAKVINALTGEATTIQLQLDHNGPFGMSLKLSVDLGKKHDGLYANLYFYNPKSGELEFQSASMISGGKASWAFDHASDCAIVIDKESHEPMTFIDVPDSAYYAEAVNWAVAKKITEGVGNKLFAPNAPCTRAQIVTFLWRAAGSPGPKTMSGFSDVPADSYYAKAVAWAVENGITGGTGDGKFSPDATCTRAQAVTFLYRASGAPAVSGNAAFSDVATNAYYAAAVKWAEKNGITGGIGGGLFGSDNNCTRAQIVTFLYRNYQSK